MDSRAYWFGAALALAFLLFWNKRGMFGSSSTLTRNGVPASSGSPAGTGPGPGAGASKDCGCGYSGGSVLTISPFPAPSAPNFSAPASISSFGNAIKQTAPATNSGQRFSLINARFPLY